MKLRVGGIIAIGIGIAVAIGFFGLGFEVNKTDYVFHVTLADPAMYENGVFTDFIEIEEGSYQFGFVPNGDSPKTLTISLSGSEYSSVNRFILDSVSHETGISQYYTWSYSGESSIKIPSSQRLKIIIDPHENYNGPVSVFLKKMPYEN